MTERLRQGDGLANERQRRKEEEHPIYRETGRRLSRIDEILSEKGATCTIEVMGIAHDFSPETILKTVDEADVITLELIRGIVKKGLDAEKVDVLDNNQFWKEIIQHLQQQDRSQKEITGIATNRDARNGVKRLRLHSGSGTLGAAFYTAEIQEEDIERLDLFLSAEEQNLLKKYKLIMVQSDPAIFTMYHLWKRKLRESGMPDNARFEQAWVTGWLKLVHAGRIMKDENRHPNMTFILPPHPSLIEVQEKTQKILEQFPVNLSTQEIKVITLLALDTFLFSPSDLTEAREITYVLDQFIKRKGVKPNQKIKVLHLGGSAHGHNISSILAESLPHNCKTIRIIHADDPRIGPMERGSIGDFFTRNIPFLKAWENISLVDHELIITDVEKTLSMIKSAIKNNCDDFLKRILIDRILTERYKNMPDTLAALKALTQDQNRLYGESLNDLQMSLQQYKLNF